MKKILSLSIKIMLIFTLIDNLFYYLRFALASNEANFILNINYFLTINFLLPFIIFILLWSLFLLFSNKISKIIIGNNDIYLEKINYKEIISIIIIVFGLYLFINNLPELLENIIMLLFYRTNNSDEYKYFNINYSFTISTIIKKIMILIISLFLLIFRRKIIKLFEKI
jgi:hypothetical protein